MRIKLCARLQKKDGTKFWDDSKGGWLEPSLMRAVRDKDMGNADKINIYQKVPFEESLKVVGKQPIRLTWVDTDKSGGIGEPNVRNHLVEMKFRKRFQLARA